MNTLAAIQQKTPLEISNAFLEFHGNAGLSHMKLQKLVYLFHGYWLQENDNRAVSADPEVWQFGPVFGGLYQTLKKFRADPIDGPKSEMLDFGPPPIATDDAYRDLIERVWRKYGNYSAGQLSDLTHKPGSPWHTMATKYGFRVPQGLKIPEDLIRSHYRADIPRLP